MICLGEKLRAAIPGSVVTLLYALGLTMTLLKVLGLLSFGWLSAAVLVGLTGVLTAASMDRRAAWVTALAVSALGVIWLLMGGLNTLMDVFRGLELHLSGVAGALPFVAGETAMLGCVLCTAAAFFVTQRSAGPYPALVVLLLTVVLIWLCDVTEALWFLLPSVLASVTLLLQGEHDITAFRVMPLAAAAVALSFAGVAIGGATVPALKDAADGLRQRIYDIFLFTGERDEFSLADVGYYPQGEGQLGGAAEPTKEPVMAVITPRKVYLRGVIRNVYTGRSWEDGTESKRYLWDSLRFQSIRSAAFDMALPQTADQTFGALLERDRVIVRMLTSSASSMFVPQRVRALTAENGVTPYFNAGSEIFATRSLRQGDVWEVEAPLFVAGDNGVAALVEACGNTADSNWEAVNRDFRALPEHLEQEVFDVAYAAVAGADTPYEMAMAIQQSLRANYEYTLDAAQQPPDMDFVSTFLLLDKKGYCTHFASAMTVMCRMVGLPARYVEGFVATPDETGMAVVTGEQGHAWTEVYFKGFGWLTFDATPVGTEHVYVTPDQLTPSDGSSQPTATPEAPQSTGTPSPSPTATATPVPSATPEISEDKDEPSPSPEATDQPDTQQPLQPPFPWWVLPAVFLPLAVAGRILWMLPGCQSRRQKSEFGRWLVWAQAAHDALRQLGLERKPDETPMGFLARVDETNCIPQVLSQLSGAESLMFYGHAVPMPEETAQARQTYELVKGELNSWQKLCMTLQRAFLPRRSRDITVR